MQNRKLLSIWAEQGLLNDQHIINELVAIPVTLFAGLLNNFKTQIASSQFWATMYSILKIPLAFLCFQKEYSHKRASLTQIFS